MSCPGRGLCDGPVGGAFQQCPVSLPPLSHLPLSLRRGWAGRGGSQKGGTSVAHVPGARVRFLSFVAATRNVETSSNLSKNDSRAPCETTWRRAALRAVVLAHRGRTCSPEGRPALRASPGDPLCLLLGALAPEPPDGFPGRLPSPQHPSPSLWAPEEDGRVSTKQVAGPASRA